MIFPTLSAFLLALAGGIPSQAAAKLAVESSLPALGSNGLAKAVDGGLATLFETARPPRPGDDVTLTFSAAIKVSRVLAITGKPDGTCRLDRGILEVSEDGETFGPSSPFEGGLAHWEGLRPVRAIRLRATGTQEASLALREIVVDSPTPMGKAEVVPRIRADTGEVPELDAWGREAKELCDRWSPIIQGLLPADGPSAPTTIDLVFKAKMEGVAHASGSTITISGPYVKCIGTISGWSSTN